MPLSNKSFKEITAWNKKKQRLILMGMACMAVYLLLSFFFGEMGIIHFSKMKMAREKSKQEIAQIEQENNNLLTEIVALKTDPFYIESLARERLGLIKDGEWTYEFYPSPKKESESPSDLKEAPRPKRTPSQMVSRPVTKER